MNQLLLWHDSENDIQKREVKKLIDKYENLRKSQYAKISSLEKKLKEVTEKLNFLESYICKGSYVS